MHRVCSHNPTMVMWIKMYDHTTRVCSHYPTLMVWIEMYDHTTRVCSHNPTLMVWIEVYDQLFNFRRLQAKTKVMAFIIRYLLFVDDCALNAGSEADMHRSVDKFSDACNDFGLTISIKKTEVKLQPAPVKPYIEPSVTDNDQRLNMLNRFTYLGYPKTLSSMTKLTPGSRKRAQHLVDYTPKSGTEEALVYRPSCFTPVKRRQCINVTPGN